MKGDDGKKSGPTPRLIERWLPIAALGVESVRERTPMTPFPAPNRLHVWWARRPLVASRAAVLASLLPADADQKKFMEILGIHGDPVAAKVRIADATARGVRLGAAAYGYPRAFSSTPGVVEKQWISSELRRAGIVDPVALDPTAGGGSIPFEATRLGISAFANDLNPVAALILRATVEWPSRYGVAVRERFLFLGRLLTERLRPQLAAFYSGEPERNTRPDGYLWARTIVCPSCTGVIPLSPNWRLAPGGTGVRLKPSLKKRVCDFEIVQEERHHSEGTVADGDAKCPYSDCGRVVDGEEVKRQAQAGGMGDQLYAVVYKRRTMTKTKSGKSRESWERGYRVPVGSDDVSALVAKQLSKKLPEWEALDVIPTEAFPKVCNDDRPIQYGMPFWRDFFSPRQLLGHGTAVEIFRVLLDEQRANGTLDDVTKAAFAYLSLSLDKLRDYNSRMTRWHSKREVVVNTFDRHDFATKWSYAEMAPLITGLGYDWAIEQTAKCIGELVSLCQPLGSPRKPPKRAGDLSLAPSSRISISNQSGDNLAFIEAGTVDAVVMDPPYYANVMYAELSDFFYVWLKRTAGHVFPELFRRKLTDKGKEAVANLASFKGTKGAKVLAGRDYQQKMAAIFTECRRVLKPDGILTVMFTHKATGAWNGLARAIIEAGFTITASWPVNTEAEGSLHIKDKAAAKSTIFLVCRPRAAKAAGSVAATYWEEVEPAVAAAVRARIPEFVAAGITGVDLYLACFGPALNELAKHWPLVRGKPRLVPMTGGKGRSHLPKKVEGEPLDDPYAVTPEDALDAARREVKRWRLEKLERSTRRVNLDPLTEFYILAWDAFGAPEFPYDEALRLARVVGLDLDHDVINRVAAKKGSSIILWDSATRAAQGKLGPEDGSRALLDAIHHAANRARNVNAGAARDLLAAHKADSATGFLPALSALLEVLPMPKIGSKATIKAKGGAGLVLGAAKDFEALEQLRRLAYASRTQTPERLSVAKKAAA